VSRIPVNYVISRVMSLGGEQLTTSNPLFCHVPWHLEAIATALTFFRVAMLYFFGIFFNFVALFKGVKSSLFVPLGVAPVKVSLSWW